jgi:hypothetical protein
MANTYVIIASTTVGSGGAASIEFTSIPQTYTDLLIKFMARNESTGPELAVISFNSSTANFSSLYLEGNGASVTAGTYARFIGTEVPSSATANTFSSHEIYIPNYTNSTNKVYTAFAASENNGTTAYTNLIAGLRSNTAAITSIKLSLTDNTDLAQYSSATLYGIKNS